MTARVSAIAYRPERLSGWVAHEAKMAPLLAGADLVLLPEYAGMEAALMAAPRGLPAGQTRVRQSARDRAIEGQCLVLQAPLVGDVPGCDIVDVNTGRAGAFVAPDHGLPPDGILADGADDTAGPVTVDADFGAICGPRRNGQVGNFAHWPEQAARDTTVRYIASLGVFDLKRPAPRRI